MKRLWKRFTAWLYYLRHPCTIITMDEAPAKGVNITFSYSGEYPDTVENMQKALNKAMSPVDGTFKFSGHFDMPDPNVLADMLKETDKGKESKDWPWKPPFLLDYEEEQERLQEAIEHVEECLDILRTGIVIGLQPEEAALGQWGVESQMHVVEGVKADFKKLSDAIAALKKGQ